MRRRNLSVALATVLLVLLISLTAGCTSGTEPVAPSSSPAEPSSQQVGPFSTTPEIPGKNPVINSFSASPESIQKNQSTTLRWDVSGATTVTIQPYIGGVNSNGTKVLTLEDSTTFTLGAINSAGSSTSTITVTVKPAIAGAPDLVVTDIWLQGETVFCSVVNIGSVESEGGTCSLLQDKQEKATKYVEAIPAGQEVTVGFSKYQFRAPLKQQTSGGFGGGAMGLVVATMSEPESVEVKVCVDVNGETKESDELNNCYVKTIGSGFEFDFAKYAHIAQWRNGSGVLKWPMVAGDTRGAAFLSTYTLEDGKSYGNALGTYPQQVAFGSLQGMFGEPYTEKPGMENKTREVELPNSAKFSAKVGFKEGASRTDGVVVSFAIIEPSGKTVTLKSMKVAYDGKLDLVEADLGPMAGQKITFVLRVEAGDNYDDDYVIWVEPKLTQGQ